MGEETVKRNEVFSAPLEITGLNWTFPGFNLIFHL
jgi:hypothetical protein